MQVTETIGKRIRKNGFNKHGFFSIYEPLILRTLKNVEAYGPIKSLTGPIERNDIVTVKMHMNELRKKFSEFLPFYKFFGKETANTAFEKGSINRKELSKFLRLLD